MSWIEITATVFGLLCVYFTVKQNIWCWPTGLVQVILYTYIFYGARLYSDSILQIIYIPMQIYGWYFWLHGGKDKQEAPVTKITGKFWVTMITFGLGLTLVWGHIMGKYFQAAAPIPDAFIVVASLYAQWLLSKKKLESWKLWIIVDVVAIGVYFYKHLYITAGLYVVFLGLAISGLLAWQRSYSKTSTE
jgi:nicotinamide mononucleotide transporter